MLYKLDICRRKERERFIWKLNWNYPIQGIVIQSLSVEYQHKFSFRHGYLLLRCSFEYARDSQNKEVIDTTPGRLHELKCKTLWLKTTHSLITELGEIKLV